MSSRLPGAPPSGGAAQGGGESGRLRARIPAALCAIVLAGFAAAIVIEAAADRFSADQPDAALGWKSDSADALARQAELLSAAGDLPSARAAAKLALSHDPLQALAIRVLGEAAARDGDLRTARVLMTEAGRRSRRDFPTQSWLFSRRLADGDIKGALQSMDGIARAQDSRGGTLITAMAGEASRAEALPLVVDQLALNPPWRFRFIRAFTNVAQPVSGVDLISALRETAAPPTAQEYGVVINRALRAGDYETGYLAWLMAIPKSRLGQLGYVHNGGFDASPDPEPFNWMLPNNRRLEASIAQAPDRDGEALHVVYAGASTPSASVKQMLLLPPGRYRLAGQERMEAIRGDQGALWAVQCAGRRTRTMLGQAPTLQAISEWKPFSLEFEVPASECPAQWLVLMRSGRGEAHSPVLIDVWYDDFSIRRVGAVGAVTTPTP